MRLDSLRMLCELTTPSDRLTRISLGRVNTSPLSNLLFAVLRSGPSGGGHVFRPRPSLQVGESEAHGVAMHCAER